MYLLVLGLILSNLQGWLIFVVQPVPPSSHEVEHMLFMGTRKFPDENDYSEFLSRNGGYSNAYTSSTNTNYYFEVGAPHLALALDRLKTSLFLTEVRFAQFFIEPLFAPNSTAREINAVNSGFFAKFTTLIFRTQ